MFIFYYKKLHTKGMFYVRNTQYSLVTFQQNYNNYTDAVRLSLRLAYLNLLKAVH